MLSGAQPVAGWKPAEGKVQSVPLPGVKAGKWSFRSLFADGRRQIRARYPNPDPTDPYRRGFLYVGNGGERVSVGYIHGVGDWMEYEVLVPAPGDYAVWVRYGHGMKAYAGQSDMGGRTSITVDGGGRIPLVNLPDTGTSRIHRWSRCASVPLSAGRHVLRWRNDQGGGLDLDAFALADDPSWTPTEAEPPAAASGKHVVLVEAESFRAAGAPQLAFRLVGMESRNYDKTSFSYAPGTAKPAWAGAELHIFPGGSCRNFKEILAIEAIDAAARRITVGGKEARVGLVPGDRYFVENVREELDWPGEWHLDKDSGLLHYWPDRPAAETTVTAPVLGRMFEFRGDPARGRPVSHIRLAGLTIQETDYGPDDGCEGSQMGNDGVVYLADARACAVEDCTFLNIGKCAVCIAGGGDNRVSGNNVSQGAEGGVLLLKTRRNTVSDNHIHHCGLVYKHVGAVVLDGAGTDENVVSHNHVHDLARYGISLKEAGTGNVIEYNHVAHTNLETYDTDGIEVTQNNRDLHSGGVIRYNLVHDTIGYSSIREHGIFLAWGIYLDSFAGGYTVSHNIVYRNSYGGLFIQGGKDNKVSNNILIDNGLAQFHVANFQKHVTGLEFCRNLVVNRSPRVSLLWLFNEGEKVTHFERNLYFHADGGTVQFPGGLSPAAWQQAGRDQGSLVGDPQFMDPGRGDYALRPGSPALALGFEPIDTSKIAPETTLRLEPTCRLVMPPRGFRLLLVGTK